MRFGLLASVAVVLMSSASEMDTQCRSGGEKDARGLLIDILQGDTIAQEMEEGEKSGESIQITRRLHAR